MLRSSPGVALHGAQGGEGSKACLCMTVVACSLYVREEMCVCVCASPHVTPSQTTVLGRPIAITKERRGWPCMCIRHFSYTPKKSSEEGAKIGLLSGR